MLWRLLRNRFVDPLVPVNDGEWAEVKAIMRRTLRDDPPACSNCLERQLPALVLLTMLIMFVAATGVASACLVSFVGGGLVVAGLVRAMCLPLPIGEYVRMAVWRRGAEICVDCGYWLRQLDATITCCPECGSTRMAKDGIGFE